MTRERRVNRGPRAAADNRAALIAAAREVFAERGFDAPVHLIARRAGVGQGSLYRHFPDRESIAVALFEENITQLEELAARPGTTLGTVLSAMVDQIVASIAFVAMLAPATDPRLIEANERVQRLIETRLEGARKAGEIRDDITTEDLMLALGMVADRLRTADAVSRTEVGHRAWELLRRGLCP